jgi:hypothetical protein
MVRDLFHLVVVDLYLRAGIPANPTTGIVWENTSRMASVTMSGRSN